MYLKHVANISTTLYSQRLAIQKNTCEKYQPPYVIFTNGNNFSRTHFRQRGSVIQACYTVQCSKLQIEGCENTQGAKNIAVTFLLN